MLSIPLGQVAIYKLKTFWNSSSGGTHNEAASETGGINLQAPASV